MKDMINVKDFDINNIDEKYVISLDRFNSIDDFKYFVENIYKVDYSKIETIMNDYSDLRLCDFKIEFRNYFITFIIDEKLNIDKYKSERLSRIKQIYKSFEIGYCKDYNDLMKHLEENQLLEEILNNDFDLDDNTYYDLIKKHRNKELTFNECLIIVKS